MKVAQLQSGKCSLNGRSLKGKSVNVTYTGFPPFIEYSEPLGGSDVQTLKLIAKKHEFKFDLIIAKTPNEMVNLVSEKNTPHISSSYSSLTYVYLL